MAAQRNQIAIRRMLSFLLIVILLAGTVMLSGRPVFADFEVEPFKVGHYYFRYTAYDDSVVYSKYKTKKYKKTPVKTMHFVTNGNDIVYLAGKTIKCYTISSNKTKTLKRLPNNKCRYELIVVKGNYLWISQYRSGGRTCNLYVFNLKTNKLQLKKKGMEIGCLNGDYYVGLKCKKRVIDKFSVKSSVGNENYKIIGQKAAIYKLTRKGKIIKIKNLGEVNGLSYFDTPDVAIKYLSYVTGKAHKVCRIKYNGKNKKVIKSFKEIIAEYWDLDYIWITDKKKIWTYNCKTGKREEW